MKATGIIRRIDDLGRIVIPKEIRRTLTINEGDPLEIYTENNGNIILKKYSPIGELKTFAKDYCLSIGKATSFIVCVCDKEKIISTSNNNKALMEKNISQELLAFLEKRETKLLNTSSKNYINILENEKIKSSPSQIISPIISNGDLMGAVIILSSKDELTENDVIIAEIASNFLSTQVNV